MRYKLQTIPFFRRVRLTFTAVSWKPSEISGASADPLSCSIHLPWAQSVLSVPPLLQVGNVLSYFLAIPKLSALGNSHLLSDMPARAEKRDKRAERFQCWLANPYLKKGMQNQIEFKSWKKKSNYTACIQNIFLSKAGIEIFVVGNLVTTEKSSLSKAYFLILKCISHLSWNWALFTYLHQLLY